MESVLSKLFGKIAGPAHYNAKQICHEAEPDQRWLEVQKRVAEAKKIIDLGCGNNPVKGAIVGVDSYIEPQERSLGSCPRIDAQKMKEKGILFVNARVDSKLPFADKEFDFAYSRHVFEHVENPALACKEMMRIAKSGVIIAPSILSELMFGRAYHRWLVMERNDMIIFFKKRPFEDRPFGDDPRWDQKSKEWIVEQDSNPFDIILNDGGWYHGKGQSPRLADILRKYWYSHSPIIETIFLWEDGFRYNIYE